MAQPPDPGTSLSPYARSASIPAFQGGWLNTYNTQMAIHGQWLQHILEVFITEAPHSWGPRKAALPFTEEH